MREASALSAEFYSFKEMEKVAESVLEGVMLFFCALRTSRSVS